MPRFGYRAAPMGRYMAGPVMDLGADLYRFYLAWDASVSPLVVGYRIKATFQDGSVLPAKDVGNVLDSYYGVRRGGTYTFTVVGLEADNSETPTGATLSATWTPGP